MKRGAEEMEEVGVGGAPASFSFRLLFPSKEAGTIIGKGGVNIKAIREQSGCTISISDHQQTGIERLTTITGTAAGIGMAVALALDVLDDDPQAVATQGVQVERALRCVLTNNEAGRVIGKGGVSVKQIRESSGASVKMDSEAGLDRVVLLGGTKQSIVNAIQQILDIMAAMPPGTQGVGSTKRQALSAPGGYPSYGAPPAYGQAYGSPYGVAYGQQPAAYSPYGASPYQSYPAVSSASAELPPAELVQYVSRECAGRLIGRQGTGIKELRAMFPRAHINIAADAEPGNDYRKVTITGQLEDVQAAAGGILQKLLVK
ncbi:hypothetical protein AB1Y20_014588 [Prymnesium parvum]|uniref:K Homology domain-containing protein n=1 Tax=Prymnesium parvum TaxID=97485 RepID=A0AB34IB10_PRYPA